MRIFNLGTLKTWREKYPQADQALRAWYKTVKKAEWSNSADVKKSYATASIVTSTRVVFNIHHNDYRIVVAIRYDKQRVFLRFFGTHKEYDEIDAATV
ncbi:MAG TPA: type II toxin-antitoxin system HigB family toxin [Polyangiales bacterium]